MVITLCGSTRYKKEFDIINKQLSLKGNIVFSLPIFSKVDNNLLSKDDIKVLKNIHLRKIDMSDAIMVVNVDHYIGDGTLNEIYYAITQNKQVLFYNQMSDDDKKDLIDRLVNKVADTLSFDKIFGNAGGGY